MPKRIHPDAPPEAQPRLDADMPARTPADFDAIESAIATATARPSLKFTQAAAYRSLRAAMLYRPDDDVDALLGVSVPLSDAASLTPIARHAIRVFVP